VARPLHRRVGVALAEAACDKRRTAIEPNPERYLADWKIGCIEKFACGFEADPLLELANRRARPFAEQPGHMAP
jgi:hypothetical protein